MTSDNVDGDDGDDGDGDVGGGDDVAGSENVITPIIRWVHSHHTRGLNHICYNVELEAYVLEFLVRMLPIETLSYNVICWNSYLESYLFELLESYLLELLESYLLEILVRILSFGTLS